MKKTDKAAKAATQKGERLNPSTSSIHIVAAPVKAISDQTTDQDETLNAKEQKLLAECETDINKNMQGAFVLGWRLEQIKEQKLYRTNYSTFANYCSKRWDFSKTHANRLIQAYLCENHLKSVKDVEVYVPTKEAQVRHIADLEPEQQVVVAHAVFEAVGDGSASAGDFGEAREKLFPKPKPVVKETKPKAEAVVPVQIDPILVSFTEIKKKLQNLYNIFTNSAKKQDGLNLIGKIQKDLELWADWEAKQVNEREAV